MSCCQSFQLLSEIYNTLLDLDCALETYVLAECGFAFLRNV